NKGSILDLAGGKDKHVLGRDPECEVHIPVTSVSRRHAQIVLQQGKFFIEDLQSRNGTFVNNQAITARTPLRNNDRIRICDFVAAFRDTVDPFATTDQVAVDEEEDDSASTVEAMLPPSKALLETQPAEKLRGLLEISSNLSKTLELDQLLPKIVDCLFGL